MSPLVGHAPHRLGLVGFCPGTPLGAIGEGPVDAFWGIFNMLLGGTAYVDLYPQLKEGVLIWRIYEKIIPPQLFGVNPWRMVLAMIVLALGMFRWFEKKGL